MISRDRWQRLEPILDTALDLPADQVAAHLRRSCGHEPAVLDEAERLLTVMRNPESVTLLESPPLALVAHALIDPESDLAATVDLREGSAVGPYRILRPLGRGGMGVVYLAHDPRLDRLVALKLLPPWIAADESATQSLVEEARAASALDHPNIETIYDVGTTEQGLPYFAMAYYEGVTLADRIREGPLPVADALAVAMQLVAGVRAAHALRIIHRDIKPANVILTPGDVAKILDFGLAGAAAASQGGSARGTAAYMSPEQTRGSTGLRTDVWSLGVVLYEMLAGRRPFDGPDAAAVIHAIRNEEPTPLEEVRPSVPQRIADLVHRCLAKDANARFADAASLSDALAHCQEGVAAPAPRSRMPRPGVALAVSAMVAAAAMVGVLLRDGPPSPPTDTPLSARTRLAVFPLSDVRGDPDDAYLAGAMTAELTLLLSESERLSVISPGLATPGDRTEAGSARIGRELGATAVLRGDVEASPEGVELSLQLIDVTSLDPLWSARYTAAPGDLPSVQDEIVHDVSAALALPDVARASEADVIDVPEAYTEYLKGRYFLDRLEPDATVAARDHFTRALDLDPTFASAWSGLSGAYNQMWTWGLVAADDAGPRARAAAERALELDPELPEAYSHLAAVLGWYYRDMAGVERNDQRALALAPSSARVYRHYAVHLRNLGRFDEALAAVRRASELEPLSPGNSRGEGMILYLARRYDEAIRKYEELLRVDPRDTPARIYIALARSQLGQLERALAQLREADPDARQKEAVSIRGYVLGRLGMEAEALRMLSRLDELSPAPYALSFSKAVVWMGLGETDRALDLLEQAVDARATQVQILGVEPVFDPLRQDPRFQALLERLGLVGQ